MTADTEGNTMTTFVLTAPLTISARLLPGIRISDAHNSAWISVEPVTITDGRVSWSVYIDTSDHGELYVGPSDVSTGAQWRADGDGAREAISCVLTFLSAEAEAYVYHFMRRGDSPPDGWIFNATVAEWAYSMADEIDMAECELQEDGDDA